MRPPFVIFAYSGIGSSQLWISLHRFPSMCSQTKKNVIRTLPIFSSLGNTSLTAPAELPTQGVFMSVLVALTFPSLCLNITRANRCARSRELQKPVFRPTISVDASSGTTKQYAGQVFFWLYKRLTLIQLFKICPQGCAT